MSVHLFACMLVLFNYITVGKFSGIVPQGDGFRGFYSVTKYFYGCKYHWFHRSSSHGFDCTLSLPVFLFFFFGPSAKRHGTHKPFGARCHLFKVGSFGAIAADPPDSSERDCYQVGRRVTQKQERSSEHCGRRDGSQMIAKWPSRWSIVSLSFYSYFSFAGSSRQLRLSDPKISRSFFSSKLRTGEVISSRCWTEDGDYLWLNVTFQHCGSHNFWYFEKRRKSTLPKRSKSQGLAPRKEQDPEVLFFRCNLFASWFSSFSLFKNVL